MQYSSENVNKIWKNEEDSLDIGPHINSTWSSLFKWKYFKRNREKQIDGREGIRLQMRFVSVGTSRERGKETEKMTNDLQNERKKSSKTMWQCPKLNEKSSVWFHASSVQIPNTYHCAAYEAICSCASNVSHECACTSRQFTHMFELSNSFFCFPITETQTFLNRIYWKLNTLAQHNFLCNRNRHANWKFSKLSCQKKYKNYVDAWHTSIAKQKLFCRSFDKWFAYFCMHRRDILKKNPLKNREILKYIDLFT